MLSYQVREKLLKALLFFFFKVVFYQLHMYINESLFFCFTSIAPFPSLFIATQLTSFPFFYAFCFLQLIFVFVTDLFHLFSNLPPIFPQNKLTCSMFQHFGQPLSLFFLEVLCLKIHSHYLAWLLCKSASEPFFFFFWSPSSFGDPFCLLS